MKRLLEYMEEHYGEKITVEDGAKLCFYSNSHFMKYFKQYMGVPFIQYLNEFRLERRRECCSPPGSGDGSGPEMRV